MQENRPFPLYKWQHVALVADGSILRLYRNGIEVGTVNCDGVLKVPPIKHMVIGGQDGYPQDLPEVMKPVKCWQGLIDELAIFYRALSAKQVRQLFDGPFAEPPAAAPPYGKEGPSL